MEFYLDFIKVDNKSIGEHFIFHNAELSIKLFFSDYTIREEILTKNSLNQEYYKDLTQFTVVPKNQNTILIGFVIRYKVFLKEQSIEDIIQHFTIISSKVYETENSTVFDFSIKPSGWINHSGVKTISNFAIHPYLRILQKSKSTIVTLNLLYIDITEIFLRLLKEVKEKNDVSFFNKYFLYYKDNLDWKLRICLYTGGEPLVWYVALPKKFESFKKITPNLFFRPFGGFSYSYSQDTEKGIIDTKEHFLKGFPIMIYYLLKPLTPNKEMELISSNFLEEKGNFTFRFDRLRDRMTVNDVELKDDISKGVFVDALWISRGLADAMAKSGKEQILILPLSNNGRYGNIPQSSNVSNILTHLVNSFYIKEFSKEFKLPIIENIIVSTTSRGGEHAIPCAANNVSNLKGLILCETNTRSIKDFGEKTLLKFSRTILQKGKKIILTGRFQFEDNAIIQTLNDKNITMLPNRNTLNEKIHNDFLSHFSNISGQPESVKSNQVFKWFEYIISRLMHPKDDSSIELLSMLLFGDINRISQNIDSHKSDIKNKVITSSWWNIDNSGGMLHQFCISGGQIFEQASTDNEPQYKTYFQEAIEILG